MLADDYGGASAVAFSTPERSGHRVDNQEWLWSTRGYSGEILVQIGGSCLKAEHLYVTSAVVTTFSSRYGIAEAHHLPIAICRGLRKPPASVWPDSKEYL